MKTNLLLAGFALFALSACQRDVKDLPVNPEANSNQTSELGKNAVSSVQNNPTGVYLVENTEYNYMLPGNQFRWTWKITNTNPGNGNGGSVQGLSHWGFAPSMGGCFGLGDIVSAAYSQNGVVWTTFTPSISPDPSQNCFTGPILKFDFGTNGAAPSYFRLILNKAVGRGTATGVYKSGKKTGCGTFQFIGINCSGPVIVTGNPLGGT